MKTILAAIASLLSVVTAFAQQTCPTPEQNVVVYFGNGILTTRRDADRSLDVLKDELGTSYNNQNLSYGLAYNYTDGVSRDLIQSAVQLESQFDSQVMAWLNRIQVAPDWFNTLLQRLYLAAYTVNAPELTDHVAKYQQAINRGQKVLVVSHSQGNLYVNEARTLLQAAVTVEQMSSFAIFGVATPANNVGGASGPYFTNHRDVILLTAGALPQNWALHHADGTLADDLARLPAHGFVDTYMSTNYDMRPALVLGIKGQLSSLKAPIPVCDNYRKQFIGLLAGSYPAKCNGKTVSSASLDKSALASFPDGVVDLSGPNVTVSVSRQLVNTSNIGDIRGINLLTNAVGGGVGGHWSIAGDFEVLQSAAPNTDCRSSADTPSSVIAAPVDIAAKVAELLRGYRGGFAANNCVLNNGSVSSRPAGWQSVAVNGTMLSIAGVDYDMAATRIRESVLISPANGFSPVDYEPQFGFSAEFSDGAQLFLLYRSIRGLQSVSYGNRSTGIACLLN